MARPRPRGPQHEISLPPFIEDAEIEPEEPVERPPTRRGSEAGMPERWGKLPEPPAATDPQEEAATLKRLDESVAWYERGAGRNGNLFKTFKVVTLASGAAIPVLVGIGLTVPTWAAIAPAVAGILGALIVVVEGLQQLFQWQHNWLAYRSTADALKSEGALFAARAGVYEGVTHPHKLLASRVEQLLGGDNQSWTTGRGDSRPSVSRSSF